jgi:hypothetical protein
MLLRSRTTPPTTLANNNNGGHRLQPLPLTTTEDISPRALCCPPAQPRSPYWTRQSLLGPARPTRPSPSTSQRHLPPPPRLARCPLPPCRGLSGTLPCLLPLRHGRPPALPRRLRRRGLGAPPVTRAAAPQRPGIPPHFFFYTALLRPAAPGSIRTTNAWLPSWAPTTLGPHAHGTRPCGPGRGHSFQTRVTSPWSRYALRTAPTRTLPSGLPLTTWSRPHGPSRPTRVPALSRTLTVTSPRPGSAPRHLPDSDAPDLRGSP